MVIVAHPDDAEYVVAGTVAKWAGQGCEVTYVIVTDGSKGTSDATIDPKDLVVLREAEQLSAAGVLGVKNVIFLHHEDGVLCPTIELRRDIVRAIRQYRPEAAFCEDPTMRWSSGDYINHPDHIAAADAALAAIYPSARDHLFFPELLQEGLAPHKVKDVYITAPVEPDTWIDIAETIDIKVAALLQHRSQLSNGEEAEWVRQWARETGCKLGMKYAEEFKHFRLE